MNFQTISGGLASINISDMSSSNSSASEAGSSNGSTAEGRVSRKRNAARRLMPVSSSNTETAAEMKQSPSRESLSEQSEFDDDCEKRQRFDSGSTTDSQESLITVPCELNTPGSSQFVPPTTIPCAKVFQAREKLEALANGSIYGDFQIVGAGRDTQAINLKTEEIFNCRVISDSEYICIQRVVVRLQEAGKYYKEYDLQEMKDMVFPCDSELIEEESGRKLLFTPTHYGSLHSFAYHRGNEMSEADVQPIFFQMVKLVAFCHTIGVVVREIKPRRFSFSNKQRTKLRLSTVQEVIVCEDPNNDILKDKLGSPAYIAPEVLCSGCTGYAGKTADVWGIGVVLYLLLIGRYPFFDSTPVGVFNKIKRAKIVIPTTHNLSRSVRALLFGILRRDPSERPTAHELQFMPWPQPSKTAVKLTPPRMQRLSLETAMSVIRRIADEAISGLSEALREGEDWVSPNDERRRPRVAQRTTNTVPEARGSSGVHEFRMNNRSYRMTPVVYPPTTGDVPADSVPEVRLLQATA